MGIISDLTDNRDKVGLDGPVDFIFDEEVMEKTPLLKSWDWVIENISDEQRENVGHTPTFRDDEDFLPIQAADLAAWWGRRWWEEGAGGRAVPEPPWKARREIPTLYTKYDEKRLREIFQATVQNVPPPLGPG